MRNFDYITNPAKLLTPEIVQMVGSIHEHKGKQELFLEANIDELKTLLEVALIQSTGASNRIEGLFTSDKRLEDHSLLMGKEESKLDEYLKEYDKSEIQAFCTGIEKDILPVKNAISFSISSGFVEGNNNKFKVLKRIVYGRSGLVNLEKKCKLAFMSKSEDFSLSELL